MNYLEARRIEKEMRRFRQLAVDYWAASPPIQWGSDGWMAGPDRPFYRENAEAPALRQQISTGEVEVATWAAQLGVATSGYSYPAPAVGGPVIPFNLLASVTAQRFGHSAADRNEILDAIDRTIGAAAAIKRRLGFRLIKPWCWLVDLPALLVGWPFAVMRKAGVPDSVIDSTGSKILQGVLAAALSVGGFIYAIWKVGLLNAIVDLLP